MPNRISLPSLLADVYLNRYTEDLQFWERLAKKTSGPILELGCGSGRILLSIADQQKMLVGVEIRHDYLLILKKRAEIKQYQNVVYFQANITNFNLNLKFDLICIPCNTYSSLTEIQRRAALQCAGKHLSESGILVISLPNPSLFKDLPETGDLEVEDVFPHPVDNEPVQVSTRWECFSDHIDIFWFYDHLKSDGQVNRYREVVRHYLLSNEEYLAELNQSGFISRFVYGDYDLSHYEEGSPHLILVSDKKKKI